MVTTAPMVTKGRMVTTAPMVTEVRMVTWYQCSLLPSGFLQRSRTFTGMHVGGRQLGAGTRGVTEGATVRARGVTVRWHPRLCSTRQEQRQENRLAEKPKPLLSKEVVIIKKPKNNPSFRSNMVRAKNASKRENRVNED